MNTELLIRIFLRKEQTKKKAGVFYDSDSDEEAQTQPEQQSSFLKNFDPKNEEIKKITNENLEKDKTIQELLKKNEEKNNNYEIYFENLTEISKEKDQFIKENGVLALTQGKNHVRLVTHRGIEKEDIEKTATTIERILSKAQLN